MNDASRKPPETPGDADREAARRKLMGRAVVVGLLLLTAIYALFTYLGRR